MKSTTNESVAIQDRDIDLLLGLYESRLMTLAHAAALYFAGKPEAAKKRVQRLKAAGFIGERPRRAYEPSVLFLARAGFDLLQDHGVAAMYPPANWASFEKRARVKGSTLGERLGAFNYLVESHYRYYQFLANTLVATAFAYSVNRWLGTSPLFGAGTDAGVLILCAALFAGSRDTLTKYYARTRRLVGEVAEKGDEVMINGNHHEAGGTATSKRRPEEKPTPKSETSAKTKEAQPKKTDSSK